MTDPANPFAASEVPLSDTAEEKQRREQAARAPERPQWHQIKTHPVHDPEHQPQGIPEADAVEPEEAPPEPRLLRGTLVFRETTLRALGLVKGWTALAFLIAAGVVLASGTRLGGLVPRRFLTLLPNLPWETILLAGALGLAALGNAVIGLSLWYLQHTGRILQGIVSGIAMAAVLPGLALLTLSLWMGGGGAVEFVVAFSVMVLGAIHMVVIYLLFSSPTAQVCSAEYADAIQQTPDTNLQAALIVKTVWWSITWAIGAAALFFIVTGLT